MRRAPVIRLSPEQRRVLESQARSRSLPLRVVERAHIVLFAAAGRQDKEIAVLLSMTPKKVSRWRNRFIALGVAGLLKDAPRPGRKPTISDRLTQRVVTLTTRQQPSNATHWSTRTMAAVVGISKASVRRIWRAHGLKPHRVETFKISNDPAFAEKLEDIVGPYLNPPEHALVLCVDEKSQIQALDRTQPGLPLKRGRSATMTHDYKRNGTATLFAPLNAANGEVYGLRQERHRHQEWLKFLRPARPNYAGASHLALDRRQLRYPQTPQGPTLAGATPAASYALHPHQRVVAQQAGALLPRSHPEPTTARRLSRSRRADHGYRHLYRPSQRETETLHLDGPCFRYLALH
jgi:transposase